MQTVSRGDSLHEQPKPIFWKKNKKNISKYLLKISPSMLSVNPQLRQINLPVLTFYHSALSLNQYNYRLVAGLNGFKFISLSIDVVKTNQKSLIKITQCGIQQR